MRWWTIPATKKVCTSMMTGTSRIVRLIDACPRATKISIATSRTGIASAKCTEADDTVIAIPATKKVCTSMMTGTSRIVRLIDACPRATKISIATSRTGIASAKCTRCDNTTTSGNASAGNITFLIRPALLEIDVVDSRTAAEKKVQGRMPANKNNGYGRMTCGKNRVNTSVYTARSRSGLASDQK